MRAHHLAIRARDVQAVAAFYRDVLLLPLADAPRPGVVWLRAGELLLMIEPHVVEQAAIEDQVERPGLHLLSFAIEPSERAHWEQRLSAHGIAIVNRTDYTLYFHDPEGTRVALSHYPARA